MGTDTIIVEILECGVELEMPNIFTPNGDLQNDAFTPIIITGAASLNAKIFNRWGQEVYSTDNPKVEWDGKNKSGSEVVEGAYFWVISVNGLDQKTYTFKGTVTLMR